MADSNPFFTPQVLTAIGIGTLAIVWYLYKSNDQDDVAQAHGHHPQRQAPEKLERLPVGKLTIDEIKPFTGENKSRILVSVCGRIFDLTKGRDFYGHPDGPYNCFAGGDASYMLGAMSLEVTHRNKTDFEPDGDHQITLSDWISRYRAKYPIVGRLAGFESLCADSWREAGNDDVVDANLDINTIYDNEFRTVSAAELAECAGYTADNKWLSLCGIVFDVKSAEVVYEAMYGDFPGAIGKDISVALLRNEFSAETYNQSLLEFDGEQQKLAKLKKYLKLFLETYPIVGFLEDAEKKYRLSKLSSISDEWDIVQQSELENGGDEQKADK